MLVRVYASAYSMTRNFYTNLLSTEGSAVLSCPVGSGFSDGHRLRQHSDHLPVSRSVSISCVFGRSLIAEWSFLAAFLLRFSPSRQPIHRDNRTSSVFSGCLLPLVALINGPVTTTWFACRAVLGGALFESTLTPLSLGCHCSPGFLARSTNFQTLITSTDVLTVLGGECKWQQLRARIWQ